MPKGLIGRHDLVAALDRAAGKQVTIISAPAGSGKTSLLHEWAERAGQQRRIAFMSVPPGQHDAQLFWLALLGAVRAANGGAEPPAAAPGFNGQAMVDKVLAELAAPGGPFVLIIDDLHELSSAEAAGQLTTLLTSLPPGVRAVQRGDQVVAADQPAGGRARPAAPRGRHVGHRAVSSSTRSG